jgi:hypothetical protein
MLTDTQKEAIEAFLLVRCRKGDCDGPWCEVRAKIWKAFEYPDDWKTQKKIEAHHQAIKVITSKLKDLAEERLSLDTLRQSNSLTNSLSRISSCMYDKYFRPPPVEIKSGSDDFKERIGEVVGSGESFVVVNEAGEATLSGGGCDNFDSFSVCDVCFSNLKL